MSAELRKLFETGLQNYFKEHLKVEDQVVVTKNKLKVGTQKDASPHGYIGFDYLYRARHCVLYTAAIVPELSDFFESIKPPYKANIAPGFAYAMNTSMETGFKSFSPNLGGSIAVPKTDIERDKVYEWIYGKVRDIYLPRLKNIIELNQPSITDIKTFPHYYAYPFATVIFLWKKSALKPSETDISQLKKIMKNKAFDASLLDML